MKLSKFVPTIGALLAASLAACAGDSSVVEGMMVMPSYFDTLQCSELIGQFQSASQRLYELTILREKAANQPGGAVANVLAYNTEYTKAEATKKYSEAAAHRKGCDLTKKPAVSAKPHPDASTGPRRHGEHPPPGPAGVSQ